MHYFAKLNNLDEDKEFKFKNIFTLYAGRRGKVILPAMFELKIPAKYFVYF